MHTPEQIAEALAAYDSELGPSAYSYDVARSATCLNYEELRALAFRKARLNKANGEHLVSCRRCRSALVILASNGGAVDSALLLEKTWRAQQAGGSLAKFVWSLGSSSLSAMRVAIWGSILIVLGIVAFVLAAFIPRPVKNALPAEVTEPIPLPSDTPQLPLPANQDESLHKHEQPIPVTDPVEFDGGSHTMIASISASVETPTFTVGTANELGYRNDDRAASKRNYGTALHAGPFGRRWVLHSRSEDSQAYATESGHIMYVVQPHESLTSIALKLLGDANRWNEIFDANRESIKDPNQIQAGQCLRIPTGGGEVKVHQARIE